MLPQDPFILLSCVNTELRDTFSSPEALCEEYGVSVEELKAKLSAVGFTYDVELNQFRCTQ